MLRLALWILLAAGVVWGWYSTTSLLGAASAFDQLFPQVGPQRLSGWANVLAVVQFLAVTIGPAILIASILVFMELSRRRQRRVNSNE